jgi:hypothetical protein
MDYIVQAIAGLNRLPGTANAGARKRLLDIKPYFERTRPTGLFPHISEFQWLYDDIVAIHRVMGTFVAIWSTENARDEGRLHLLLVVFSVNFLSTKQTMIEASPNHFTCYGHGEAT